MKNEKSNTLISSKMGVNYSKVNCMILPAQSGKTRRVEEEITKYNHMNQLVGDYGDVNIWISSNNKLLVHQTTCRIRTDLTIESDAVIKGKVFSWTSGTTKISENDLICELNRTDGNHIEMIVLCANPIRLKYLDNMLKKLVISPFQKKINIWIDEADKSISSYSKYEEIVDNPLIKKITFVSATIDSIISKYKKIHILPYEITHPTCYRRLTDSVIIKEDVLKTTATEYISHILTKYPNLVQPGKRAFIPGNYKKSSHEEISQLLEELGFAVIILNGDKKEIRIPKEEPINLKDYLTVSKHEVPEEFNHILAKMYKENNLERYPLAITGYLCVERGITFQCNKNLIHDGFLFDYGIIPPIGDKVEAYQTMARLFGNVGDFQSYKSCEIYSNTATFDKVANQEEIAVNLSRIVYEKKLEEVDKQIIDEISSFDQKEVTIDRDSKLFDTQEEALQFAKTLGIKLKKRHNDMAPKELFNIKENRNPTVDELQKRWWGLSKETLIRMIPTNEKQWFLYWRPSTFPKV